MMFEKTCIGENNLENLQIKYFVIKKDNLYGIEIEENHVDQLICDYEYFTHKQHEAEELAHKMSTGLVTLTTMIEIIDDYVQ